MPQPMMWASCGQVDTSEGGSARMSVDWAGAVDRSTTRRSTMRILDGFSFTRPMVRAGLEPRTARSKLSNLEEAIAGRRCLFKSAPSSLHVSLDRVGQDAAKGAPARVVGRTCAPMHRDPAWFVL